MKKRGNWALYNNRILTYLGQLIQLPDLPTTKYCSRCQKRQVLKLVGIYLLGFGIRSSYGLSLIPSPFFYVINNATIIHYTYVRKCVSAHMTALQKSLLHVLCLFYSRNIQYIYIFLNQHSLYIINQKIYLFKIFVPIIHKIQNYIQNNF
ncbi:hypothetical protein GLOIN_2v67231 [Rhizophagus irregularis DAOM 181602=DAOM 197198]|uniref:Transmembrane protein n=1 Tax=Rhizophagus irregularis (strain DAOM 181602 / DAOM 197198 / MUCL 43194) TaxID=747089 RepID=A0A2P4QUQ7_RHIID|nr:hypothetical protein GLOIN_2v67231 [Rhizophagus irregularis DAOM 181602=DAOM 197198]POG81371.1 hypothetical protein GLOIN_2v67231 [Rhizophagus irregularis DAOM 181602=DAOM 197198]|eukprot:XP_025188237.1 hypothetical protein GLOIN_2v67231 [Rhizophagus irregularis DAOM 181602=DAOM 197198]